MVQDRKEVGSLVSQKQHQHLYRWTLSYNLRSQIAADMYAMYNHSPFCTHFHNEATKSRQSGTPMIRGHYSQPSMDSKCLHQFHQCPCKYRYKRHSNRGDPKLVTLCQ